ncbi:MAG TPA: hypothetical protein ENK73_03850 [Thiomicrospira sp.]|nr:hypothetical protein [Thiomicrospira sp.]
MLTYQQWDLIADSYIPVLATFTLVLLLQQSKQPGTKYGLINLFHLVLSIVFIYLMMFIDQTFELWPSFGLDYSTHTALALVFVIFIGLNNVKCCIASCLSMFMYAGLMIYQEYHSVLDILTTALVVVPVVYWLQNRALHTKTA